MDATIQSSKLQLLRAVVSAFGTLGNNPGVVADVDGVTVAPVGVNAMTLTRALCIDWSARRGIK